jgi:hypothetical protein
MGFWKRTSYGYEGVTNDALYFIEKRRRRSSRRR